MAPGRRSTFAFRRNSLSMGALVVAAATAFAGPGVEAARSSPELGAASVISQPPPILARIDGVLAQSPEAGLAGLLREARVEPGQALSEQAAAARVVLTMLVDPERIPLARAQLRVSEDLRPELERRLDSLAVKALEISGLKGRRSAVAGLLEQAHGEVAGFVAAGRFDDALSGLEKWFDSRKPAGAAVLVGDAKGLGSLPIAAEKAALAAAEAGGSARGLKKRLGDAVRIIKRSRAYVESGRTAELRGALDGLAADIERHKYEPEVKALALKDVDLREALSQAQARLAALPSGERQAFKSAVEVLKNRHVLLKMGRAQEVERALEEVKLRVDGLDRRLELEEVPSPGGELGDYFEKVLPAVRSPQPTGSLRLDAAIDLARGHVRSRAGTSSTRVWQAFYYIIASATPIEKAVSAPKALALLDELAPRRGFDDMRLARFGAAFGAAFWLPVSVGSVLFALATSQPLLPVLLLFSAWTINATFVYLSLEAAGVLPDWAKTIDVLKLRARYVQANAALKAGQADYVARYRLHAEAESVKQGLLADYRSEAARLAEAESRLLAGSGASPVTALQAPTKEQTFEAGLARMLAYPEPVRGRALELLRRRIVLDAAQAAKNQESGAFDELAEHAALLAHAIPHRAWKDLKPALLSQVDAWTKAAGVDAPGLVEELGSRLETSRALGAVPEVPRLAAPYPNPLP